MAPESGLYAALDHPLGQEVAVGGGTALFLSGWCASHGGAIRELRLVVDGEPQRLLGVAAPRRDVVHARGSDAARCGFWGLARLAPGALDRRVLELSARMTDGRELRAELASLAVARASEPVQIAPPGREAREAGPLVAICMATHQPDPELLAVQLESIRNQTHRNWMCIISDDCSTSETFERLKQLVAGDPRFTLSRSPRRLGFYENFERALGLVPAIADYVALADQDDRWHADKLETLLASLGDAWLVYSDARIVDHAGRVLSASYWTERRNNHRDLLSLLVANCVSGAAALFPRELLEYALPFPPGQFSHYHDHWLAVASLALGDIAFVPRPLYDYVQHPGATLGHARANRMTRWRERLGRLSRDPRQRAQRWREHYFVDACRLLQFATVVQMRCGSRMSPSKRRALARLWRAESSWLGVARLGLRGAGELIGRRETLGAEWMLMYAFAWRRLLARLPALAGARGIPDARPPAALSPPSGLGELDPQVEAVASKIAPLPLRLDEQAPARVNLLVPTIDLAHLFGGYIAKFNLARRLAERGLRVRIVTVDPVGPLPRYWRREVEDFAGLAGLFERVEVEFARESSGLVVSPHDRFIATTWWTAHIAQRALAELGRPGAEFLYLIQEYEPLTFPPGSYFALAGQSYELSHRALFSSELLREYFRQRRIGVYAGSVEAGEARSIAFQNAITSFPSPTADELAGRHSRRLLFYARPEAHAARNLYEVGLLALRQAAVSGAFPGWELTGVGTTGRERSLELAPGVRMQLLARARQSSYGQLLREHDVGLALMLTPHPSLVPIEMAAAGIVTVTNTFENKTAERLSEISPNLLAAAPTIDSVADAIVQATAAAGDVERRAAGAAVSWSRDWEQSFPDELIDRLAAWLQG